MMGLFIKAISRKGSRMGRGYLDGLMVLFMKVSLEII